MSRTIAMAFLLTTIVGCAAPAPTQKFAAELVSPGKLTVCVSLLGALAANRDADGKLAGYNIDFGTALAGELELEATFAETQFADLITDIESHACDVSVSSQNITSGRLEHVDFVPYTRAKQRILVAKGNPRDVQEMHDLCGLLVSTTDGSIFADMIEGVGDFNGQGLSQACLAGGDLPIEVTRYPDQQAAVQALLDGSVSAHLGNPNYAYDYPDRLEQSQALLPFSRQGIGVAKDHPELLAAVQGALAELIENGRYHDILYKYLADEKRVALGSIETPAPAQTSN
jgi:ABC-type amino acid transport substrate-binding protein